LRSFLAVLLCFTALPCVAQKTFEAASLRPLQEGAKPDYTQLDVLDATHPGSWKAPSLLTIDLNLFEMIVTGYSVSNSGMHDALMAQLPLWGMKQEYHLTARIPDGATLADLRLMLQALLKERFALAAHWDNRTMPVLLLQQVSSSTNLVPFKETCKQQPANCTSDFRLKDGMVHMAFTGQTMPQIADTLSGLAHYMGGQKRGPVVDDTSLPGQWNATIDFAPLMGTNETQGDTFTTALKKQMGLVLTPSERPVPSLIIDHVEQPTAD
jgi:uncharacterized protein (TIGR03435 family)